MRNGFFGSILGFIIVIIHALLIVVGIYGILTLWDWVPSFDSLFGEDLIPCEEFTKSILFVFLTIGIVLFVNQFFFGDNIPCKVLTLIGVALMVVPSFIFHLQIMDAISSGTFHEFCSQTAHSVNHEYIGLLLIFPVICLYLTITFQLIGKDQYVIHDDYDDALGNSGVILPYLYICAGGSALMLFIAQAGGDLQFFSVLTLIVGCIALAVMGISRLKNGSPFEY